MQLHASLSIPLLVSSIEIEKALNHHYCRCILVFQKKKIATLFLRLFDPPCLATGSSHHPLPLDLGLSITLWKDNICILLILLICSHFISYMLSSFYFTSELCLYTLFPYLGLESCVSICLIAGYG